MDTKKVKTPSGVEVELKTTLTGGEMREITAMFVGQAKLEGQQITAQMTAQMFKETQDKTFEAVVVSVAGNKGNVVKDILALPVADYQFVVDEVNKITSTDKKK